MAKIIVEQLQGGNSGTALTLPTADGTAGQFIKTDGSAALSFGTVDVAGFPPADDVLSTGMIMTSSARENVYSTGEWSSSGPNSTYYNSLQDASARSQAWNMLLGDGYPTGTSQLFYVGDYNGQYQREQLFVHNQRMGHRMRSWYYQDNAATGNDYAGITLSCIPIRNHAASGSTNVVVKSYRSCGNNAYGGAGVMYFTPTFSSGTTYANANGGAWTVLESHTSNTDNKDYTATVPVAAGTTVLLFMSSAHRYHTTYRYKDTHYYYDLHNAFTGDIKCDMRMLETLFRGRQPAAIYNADTPEEMYTTCATLFGDR